MKNNLLSIFILTLFISCVKLKVEKSDRDYTPKKGDSVELLLKRWGQPDQKLSVSPETEGILIDYYYNKWNTKVNILLKTNTVNFVYRINN